MRYHCATSACTRFTGCGVDSSRCPGRGQTTAPTVTTLARALPGGAYWPMRPVRRMFVLGIGGALLLAGCAGVRTDRHRRTHPHRRCRRGRGSLRRRRATRSTSTARDRDPPRSSTSTNPRVRSGASMHSASSLPALIRDDYRICVYDRLGVGGSDDRPDLTTGTEAVRGLDALLEAAGIDKAAVRPPRRVVRRAPRLRIPHDLPRSGRRDAVAGCGLPRRADPGEVLAGRDASRERGLEQKRGEHQPVLRVHRILCAPRW